MLQDAERQFWHTIRENRNLFNRAVVTLNVSGGGGANLANYEIIESAFVPPIITLF